MRVQFSVLTHFDIHQLDTTHFLSCICLWLQCGGRVFPLSFLFTARWTCIWSVLILHILPSRGRCYRLLWMGYSTFSSRSHCEKPKQIFNPAIMYQRIDSLTMGEKFTTAVLSDSKLCQKRMWPPQAAGILNNQSIFVVFFYSCKPEELGIYWSLLILYRDGKGLSITVNTAVVVLGNVCDCNLCFLFITADIISTVEFNHSGELLATGDKGGRVVIFQQEVSTTFLN